MGYGKKKKELLLTAGPKKKPLYPEAAWCDAVQKQRMKKQVYGTRLHICQPLCPAAWNRAWQFRDAKAGLTQVALALKCNVAQLQQVVLV